MERHHDSYTAGESASRPRSIGASKEIAERRSANGNATFRRRCEEYTKTEQQYKRSAQNDIENDEC
jgi:hypothetical protein